VTEVKPMNFAVSTDLEFSSSANDLLPLSCELQQIYSNQPPFQI